MADVLVSPLGRSPGAVSGVYFALVERGHEIGEVVTVGTSHPDVQTSADTYLRPLFESMEVAYDPIHVPGTDLKDGRRNVAPYVAMVELALKNASEKDGRVHVAVTGGRSGMGALVALATNFYGADHLWHLWVEQEIEEGGTVDKLYGLTDPEGMRRSPFLNPTRAGKGRDAYDLVDLPFVDLLPLHDVLWTYRRERKVTDPTTPLARLIAEARLGDFTEIFPAGMTFALADRIMELGEQYRQAGPRERARLMVDLGEFLQQSGAVEEGERRILIDLVQGEVPYEEIFTVAQSAGKDRLGFWAWVVEHKVEIEVPARAVAAAAGVGGVLLKALELYLKANGYF